jgi:RimJ/RimL family protein N-acetyltransferase
VSSKLPPDADVCPVLRGERITLEPLKAEHALALFPLLDDDAVWRYANRRPATLAELSERYRALETRRSPDGTYLWLNWAAVAADTGIVGFVQATVSLTSQTAEIGYALARSVWSTGLGTDAVRALVTFLFETLRMRTIVASVDRRNGASLRLLQKLGFALVDERDERNLRLARARLVPGERDASG